MKDCVNCKNEVGDLRPACPVCGGVEFVWPDEDAAVTAGHVAQAAPDIRDLQATAGHHTIRATVRNAGIVSILCGALAIYMGLANRRISDINLVLAFLGGLMVIEGVWVSAIRSNACLIADGCVFVTVGVWNILISFGNAARTMNTDGTTFWVMLGIMQIIWGVQSFKQYKRLKRVVSGPDPSAEAQEWVANAIREAKAAKKRKDAGIIALTGQPGVFDPVVKAWIGHLRDDLAVFVMTCGGSEVLVLSAAQVNVKPARK